jgi:hypothetical protein
MFANTQMGGQNLGFPDVCLTPDTPPDPTPYPNISEGMMGVPGVYNVLISGMPAHNMLTVVPTSEGDDAGALGGTTSGTMMGPTTTLTGAFTVLTGGMPTTRLTSVTMQNSSNCSGVQSVPSQVTVLLLAP